MDERANPVANPQSGEQNIEGGLMRRRLGRGLNALLGGADREESQPRTAPVAVHSDQNQIHVELIERNPFQPRKEFEAEALTELADSIRQHGILQPLLVRPHGGQYQLIAGERRWLAAKQAGLEVVPCRVLELEDRRMFEAAIEENLKRKDLNVLEKAQAFRDYLDRFQCSVEELGKQLSLNRSTVSNYLRLLDLSDVAKTALASDRITNGHARAILTLDESNQIALCKRIQDEQLSVRQVEEIVRDLQQLKPDENATIPFPTSGAAASGKPELSSHVLSLQDQLREQLGAKVQIKLRSKEAGRIIIEFSNNDEFERLLRHFRRAA